MRLKSYFSGTVEAAMELAHKELGEDALLVNARPSTLETRNLGAYEVVFGVPPKIEDAATAKPIDVPARMSATDNLAQDVAELRREIERMAQSLRGGQMIVPQTASAAVGSNGAGTYRLMIENELAE